MLHYTHNILNPVNDWSFDYLAPHEFWYFGFSLWNQFEFIYFFWQIDFFYAFLVYRFIAEKLRTWETEKSNNQKSKIFGHRLELIFSNQTQIHTLRLFDADVLLGGLILLDIFISTQRVHWF